MSFSARLNRLPVLLGIAAAAGLLAGLLWPPTAHDGSVTTEAQAWFLPSAVQISRFEIADLPAVGKLPWAWRDAGQTAAEAAKVPWQLRGIVTAPTPSAIVQTTTEPAPLRIGIGETLPDGSRITQIDDNQITFERDGCRSTLTLYANGRSTAEPADDCPQQDHE